jgi:hypothetical protein
MILLFVPVILALVAVIGPLVGVRVLAHRLG